MITKDCALFSNSIPKNGVIVGIDYGTKKIGVSVTDLSQSIAFPHSIIQNTSNAINIISKIPNVCAFICGIPLNENGSEKLMCQEINKFCLKLHNKINLPILLIDERFSTKEANISELYHGANGKASFKRDRTKVSIFTKQGKHKISLNKTTYQDDDIAAMHILNKALQFIKYNSQNIC